ncbi:hypothetical protein F6W70_09530 [Microbacterium maritypicum]|uniref:Secreted protein n=2 Tax=Microbacterium maritypicum TaxID=33918 RepID=A0AAD3X642_MICMQ|nr:hypothetical protein F6W70_09530 [Microbacterium liquefaciens]
MTIAVLLAAMVAPPMASASTDVADLHPDIAQALEEIPGGVAVDATHAYWAEWDMDLRVLGSAGLAARSVGSCATGKICAYTSASLVNMYVSWGACSTSLPVPNSSQYAMRSLANARSTGYAQARNGTTVLATANAGGWTNVAGTPNSIRCVL